MATAKKARAPAKKGTSTLVAKPLTPKSKPRAVSAELTLEPVGKGEGPIAAALDPRLAAYLASMPPRHDREVSVTDTRGGQVLVALGERGHEMSLLANGERITWPVPSFYPIDYERGRVELDARGRVLTAQRTEGVVLALDPASRAACPLYRGYTGARGPWESVTCGDVLVLSNTDGLTLLVAHGERWVARSFLALRGFKQVVWDAETGVLVVCVGDLAGALHEVGVSGHRLVLGRTLEAKAPLRHPELHAGRVFVRMGPSPRPRALLEVAGLAAPRAPSDDVRARLATLADARRAEGEPRLVPVEHAPPQRESDPSVHQRMELRDGELVVRDDVDRFRLVCRRGGEEREIATTLRFPVVLDVDPSGERALVGVDRGARNAQVHELDLATGALAPVTALSHSMAVYAGDAIGTISLHGVWLVSRSGQILAREEFSRDLVFGGHAIQHATGPSPHGRLALIRMGDGRVSLATFRSDSISLVRDVAERVADVWSHEGVIFAMIDDVPCRLEIG